MTSSPFTRAVVSSMRRLYPEALADKSFDNTGLLLEAPLLPSRRNRNSVLLTVDLTRAVADEAIENNHSVVVAYHPVIFRGLKSITLDDSQQQSLLRLAANGISVYSPHTAVDIVPDGMADWLCDVVTGSLGAPEPGEQSQSPPPSSETDVTTPLEPEMPPSAKPPTRRSADHDSTDDPFVSPTPKQKSKTSRPAVQHRTYSKPAYPRPTSSYYPASLPNTRTVVTSSPQSAIDAANQITSSQTFNVNNTGAGRLIQFSTPQPLAFLITRIAHAIGLPKGFPVAIPQSASVEDIRIKTVGVCPGSGSSVLRNCRPPPDLVFTGELSHHEALAVIERGGCVVSLFHSNSERGYLWAVMREKLEKEVRREWQRVRTEAANGAEQREDKLLQDEEVEVVVSKKDRDPFGIVVLNEAPVEGLNVGS